MRTLKIALAAVVIAFASATLAQAATITVYNAPNTVYQNTANNPCVFFGPGVCPNDPALWPTPQGDTGGGTPFTPNPLVQDYAGSDYTAWLTVVGTSFILGLDINDTQGTQTLSNYTINFYDASNVLLGQYIFSGTLTVPSGNNGVGYADYILAAGCLGTEAGSGNTLTCTQYSPFLIPLGTASMTMTFGLTGANDGHDKIFAIPLGGTQPCVGAQCTPVPEPATLLLLGGGLVALAVKLRRRRS